MTAKEYIEERMPEPYKTAVLKSIGAIPDVPEPGGNGDNFSARYAQIFETTEEALNFWTRWVEELGLSGEKCQSEPKETD